MTEFEKLSRAKMYIDKLANGINPLDDTAVPDGDIVNNVRLSRCFFYVSDVLRQVIENAGVASPKRKNKKPFDITFDTIQKYPYSDEPIPVSKIAERINSLIDTDSIKKITYKNISDWLISLDLLSVETKSDGKTFKIPTDAGRDMGITTEQRIGADGSYIAVLYNRKAQQFIVDNIDAVIAMINSK